jgi:hypothetical protein
MNEARAINLINQARDIITTNGKDARRLLKALRLARSHLGENEHVLITGVVVADVRVKLTLGQFIDLVLREYEGHE